MFKKEKIFLGIGVICLFGFLIMLFSKNLSASLICLAAAAILCFLSRKYISFSIEADKEKKEKERIKLEQRQKELAGFTVVAPNLRVNEEDQKLLINDKMFDFDSIIKVELIEDENTTTKTKGKKNVSLGKALVGGMIFGVAGTVVGGLSGKTNSTSTSVEDCNKLAIRVVIKDLKDPLEYINFINHKTAKDSNEYKTAFENAQKCLSIFDIILDK